jgi:hypothetical protein
VAAVILAVDRYDDRRRAQRETWPAADPDREAALQAAYGPGIAVEANRQRRWRNAVKSVLSCRRCGQRCCR